MPTPANTAKTFNLAAGFKFKGGGGGPVGVKIEHRIGVHAPPEVVWESIYDLASWPQWNPLYPKTEGQVRIGSPIQLTVAAPGRRPRQVRGVVVDWVPLEQLHWRQSYFGGLAQSIRFVELDKLAEESCILSIGELFLGSLAGMAARQYGRGLRGGFAAMGEALKARAEAAWQAGRAATTSGA